MGSTLASGMTHLLEFWPDVDAVFVSTPEQEHAEPIKRALLAGNDLTQLDEDGRAAVRAAPR